MSNHTQELIASVSAEMERLGLLRCQLQTEVEKEGYGDLFLELDHQLGVIREREGRLDYELSIYIDDLFEEDFLSD